MSQVGGRAWTRHGRGEGRGQPRHPSATRRTQPPPLSRPRPRGPPSPAAAAAVARPRGPRASPGGDRPDPSGRAPPPRERTCGPAPGQSPRPGGLALEVPSPSLPPPFRPPPALGRRSRRRHRHRRAPRPPRNLKGSVSGTTTKWLSLPGRLRSPPIGPFLPTLRRHHWLLCGHSRRRLAEAAAARPQGRRSRLHGDQVSVRRGCWGLENRAELVEPSKS